jgi:hypothetical protein
VHVAPNNYKVVFENARVRVLAFHARPGENGASTRTPTRFWFRWINARYATSCLERRQPYARRSAGTWRGFQLGRTLAKTLERLTLIVSSWNLRRQRSECDGTPAVAI